jgi:hypothetical protein
VADQDGKMNCHRFKAVCLENFWRVVQSFAVWLGVRDVRSTGISAWHESVTTEYEKPHEVSSKAHFAFEALLFRRQDTNAMWEEGGQWDRQRGLFVVRPCLMLGPNTMMAAMQPASSISDCDAVCGTAE